MNRSHGHHKEQFNKKKYSKSGFSNGASKLQYCAANNKFVLSPFTPTMHEALYEVDAHLPWDLVVQVIVSVEKLSEMQETPTCPICLDILRVPQITRCGHCFCMTCAIRFLCFEEGTTQRPCPVCMHPMNSLELRSARIVFLDRAVATNEKHDIISTRHDKKSFALQLMKISKGSLFPEAVKFDPDVITERSILMNKILQPDQDLVMFSRFQLATVAWVRTQQALEQDQLMELHQDCLRSMQNGIEFNEKTNQIINADIEYLPSVELALEVLQGKQRAFEQQLLEATAKLKTISLSGYALCTDLIATSGTAPTFVAPHELLQRSSLKVEAEFAATSAQKAADRSFPSLPSRSPCAQKIPAVVQTFNSQTINATAPRCVGLASSNVTINPTDESYSYFYQAANGNPTFLHPMCMKALFTAASTIAPIAESCDSLNDKTVKHLLISLSSQLAASVIEVETLVVNHAARSRYPFLRHLPLGLASVQIVEIDLRQLVSKAALVPFQDEIIKRRQRRAKQKQMEAREAKVDEMKELQRALEVDDLLTRQAMLQEEEKQKLQSLFDSPSIVERPADASASAPGKAFMSDNRGNRTQASFAQITQGGGYFPALGESVKLRSTSNPSKASAEGSAANVWARGTAHPKMTDKTTKKGNTLFTFG